ncbi:hypothetical protein [Bdellovibrio sp. NC01]|uniref:hypothetical protein n=1 Tax=Bdellovibrio sp. NC01 TaxID=2220073 RepID=UPI001FEED22A|nr:hypothetical protein [Bdellovibrio sp. NC01]
MQHDTQSVESPMSSQKFAEENEINNAERLLSLGRYEEARLAFRSFQSSYPQSNFFESSRLGEAHALEGLGRWDEATKIDRDVYLKTSKDHPEIAALALYRMSFAYEATGDDLKTTAALLDAQRLGKYLPAEVAEAEIPARLASIYGKLGRDKEAMNYLNQAEKGINRIRLEKKEVGIGWLAKTYYQMGSISTNQLSADNFEQSAEGFRMVQIYLIKSMQQNDPAWSARALEQGQATYQSFLNLAETQAERKTQIEFAGTITDLLDQAELFKPLQGQKPNQFEESFFSFLQNLRKRTEDLLYQSKETMSLTEESQRFNSVKRPGRVKADSLLPEEEGLKKPIPTPPKIVPTEDPNL